MAGKISYGAVTTGLDRVYDAQNIISYPGSGSTWFNLAGSPVPNTNAATLIGSPTFDTSSLVNSISFINGSNQRFTIPYYPLTTEAFAVDIWYTVSDVPGAYTGSYPTILSCAPQIWDGWQGFIVGRNGWSVQISPTQIFAGVEISGSGGPNIGAINIATGSTYNIFLHRNTTEQRMFFYVNGSQVANYSFPNTNNFASINSTTLVQQSWQYGGINAVGKYHSIRLYRNRNFTTGEIVANYLASKNRFGL